MIIAIDGLAGSGKTTAGKGLAKAIGFRFISSGQLYRFKALEPDVDLLEAIKEHKLKIEWDVEWEGKGISAELQREEIGSKASQIALLREVREEVNSALRFVAEGGNYVIEGRDIGTVVFPEAGVKFFLTAEEGVRARRRAEQVGEEVNIAERDERDKKREIAPAKAAEDAIIIDNSYQSVEETIKEMEGRLPKDEFDFQRFLQYVLGPPVRGLFRIEVVKSHPLKYGRWILTPNHTSAWDGVCLAAVLQRSAYYIAKVELRRILGPLLSILNAVTIVRDTPDLKAIKAIRALLTKEKIVVIYPESKIFTDGIMGPFKEGAFYFLRKRMAPVVPVVIKGLERITVNTFFTRHVKIAFLDPVYPIDVFGLRENDISDKVKRLMVNAYESM